MIDLNEEVAEIAGVLIGDGCISLYSHTNNRSLIMFTGNLKNDLSYYETQLSKLILKNFGSVGHMYHRKDDNTIRYTFRDQQFVNYFINSLGFPVGRKTEIIKIHKKIYNDKNLAIACVRGIFHTDGSVYSRYSKQYKSHCRLYKNYAVVQFKMKNLGLMSQMKHIINSLGIKTTKLGAVGELTVFRITNQNEVKHFFDIFKISHPYHLDRFRSITCASSPKVADS